MYVNIHPENIREEFQFHDRNGNYTIIHWTQEFVFTMGMVDDMLKVNLWHISKTYGEDEVRLYHIKDFFFTIADIIHHTFVENVAGFDLISERVDK